ncbi:MAG: sodium:calcium antiporter [Deltaproteobacteria bacterium]|nr:sodium:calcium antiporter [Deltaproteobacteria bacterium]
MSRNWLLIALAFLATLPGLTLRLGGIHPGAGSEAIAFGAAILGASFLLTWAAEVAEMDISQGLALAFLALVAVLPEYAVDLYFAWKAASHPEYTAYATANMTGANRLLIGLAWPVIIFLHWRKSGKHVLVLPRERAVELVFLTLATVYSFVIPLRGTISMLDMVVLVALFVAYVWQIARGEAHEPEMVGPAQAIAALRTASRRSVVVLFFAFSAAVILGSAERFAEALVHLGRGHGIDEFLLVQWLAPLASEAPELIIACILTTKGDGQAGMGAMVSSKVNQWTLLVGTLPLVYSVALGRVGALHLDPRQVEEILLTAAQSFFGVAVLCNLTLSLSEAVVLLSLFAVQLLFPDTHVRHAFSLIYVTLGVAILLSKRRDFIRLFRHVLQS